jgi:hypothetical protein
MRAPLIVSNRMYSYETILAWKVVWEKICRMAYENEKPVSELIAVPDYVRMEGIAVPMDETQQSHYYNRQIPINSDVITLDHMWKYYSKVHSTKIPNVVPEFEKLHVPRSLFQSLGVGPWFRHSFPNCTVTFWNE